LSNEKNEYSNVATYYSAYIDYLQKNNKSALNGFLKIEETEEYKDIVPYYIVQIYYEEKEYKKSLEHGKKCLKATQTTKTIRKFTA
jgi:tetratricopeptide (TPR) repeat protein